MLEVLLYQRDLRGIAGIFGNHLLHAASFRHAKDVRGFAQVERHHLRAHRMHLCLPGRSGDREPAGGIERANRRKDRDDRADVSWRRSATAIG